MNAKRLTALALAALMATSTMSVAFATPTEDHVLDFASDKLYKEDEDGYIVPADGIDDFKPGDSVYLKLDDYSGASSKELDRVQAFATWEIGKSWVEDVDIIWKRGTEQATTTTGYTYSFTGAGAILGWDAADVSSTTNDATTIKNQLKNDQNFQTYVTKYLSEHYENVSGVTDNQGRYFKTEDSALAKNYEGKITQSSTWSYDTFTGSTKEELITKASLTAVGSGLVYNGKYYADVQAVTQVLVDGGINPSASTEAIWVTSDENTKGYGSSQTYKSSETEDYVKKDIGTVKLFAVGENVYWFTGDSVPMGLLTDFFGVKSAIDAGYAYHKGETLVKDEELKESSTGTTLYDGKDKTAALTAAGIKDASGYIVNGAGEGAVFQSNVDQTAKQAVEAAIDALNITFKPITSTSETTVRSYWFKIDTKESATTKDIDIVGDVYVGTSKSQAQKEDGPFSQGISVDFTLTNSDPGNKEFDNVYDYAEVAPGQRAVLSFDDDATDVEIEFGDDARFEFNARGQGKLNFAYNTKYNKEFASDYESANIDFINFEGEPTTNRTGTLYIYVDEDEKGYIYEVTDKGAKKINGAEYDYDEQAWVIRTRHLTSYALSDKKLKTVDQMSSGSSSSGSTGGSTSGSSNSGSGSNGGKYNPDTGR